MQKELIYIRQESEILILFLENFEAEDTRVLNRQNYYFRFQKPADNGETNLCRNHKGLPIYDKGILISP